MNTKRHKKHDRAPNESGVLHAPPIPLGGRRVIRIGDVRSAKRLLSRVLMLLQRGEIEESLAKTITYVASNFVTIMRDSDLEDRMSKLEEMIGK